jgi:hypothetical protein
MYILRPSSPLVTRFTVRRYFELVLLNALLVQYLVREEFFG